MSQAQKLSEKSRNFHAKIEKLDIRKDEGGKPYTVVIYNITKQISGPKSDKYGDVGQRHVIVKKGLPPKEASVGAEIVVSIGDVDLRDIAYPGPLASGRENVVAFCCIPIIIIIIGDQPRPDPTPPEGGEGTDPDKDEDTDEDPDVDTDGFIRW
jgi:hypothetical protein